MPCCLCFNSGSYRYLNKLSKKVRRSFINNTTPESVGLLTQVVFNRNYYLKDVR